jgi:hypothetical protein
MATRRVLKRIHLISTVWFMVCVVSILAVALHQAGVRWWLVFSLSGHSALVIFLLISLYLFAVFRGVGQAQQIESEHPLTTTSYYMDLYVAAPLLGGLAGIAGMMGVNSPLKFVLGIALGTLGTTFAVWVVIDPLVGLIEMALPASRRHRAERLAHVEAERQSRQEKRERLLAEAFAREERARQQWQDKLRPRAERLATLLACDASGLTRAQQEAVDIGAEAWRLGGLGCMRQLHDMTVAIRTERGHRETVDYLSCWWDGIGTWRKPSPGPV